jgi:hypothetical protein
MGPIGFSVGIFQVKRDESHCLALELPFDELEEELLGMVVFSLWSVGAPSLMCKSRHLGIDMPVSYLDF